MFIHIKSILTRARREEEGSTLVEYVLLVSLIGVAAVAGITFFGGKAQNTINASANQIP